MKLTLSSTSKTKLTIRDRFPAGYYIYSEEGCPDFLVYVKSIAERQIDPGKESGYPILPYHDIDWYPITDNLKRYSSPEINVPGTFTPIDITEVICQPFDF